MSMSRLMDMVWGCGQREARGKMHHGPSSTGSSCEGQMEEDNEPSDLRGVPLLVLLSMEGCDIEAEIVGVERFLWYPGDDDEMFESVCEN